jgi:hypothetical protein
MDKINKLLEEKKILLNEILKMKPRSPSDIEKYRKMCKEVNKLYIEELKIIPEGKEEKEAVKKIIRDITSIIRRLLEMTERAFEVEDYKEEDELTKNLAPIKKELEKAQDSYLETLNKLRIRKWH